MSTVTQAKDATSANADEPLRFITVEVTDGHITAHLSDGRIVSIPLWWSWRLEQATQQERQTVQFIGAGTTAYWPAIDEHLSVQGFLTGAPAPRPTFADKQIPAEICR